MTMTDTIKARGQVAPSFINLATGKMEPWGMRHNTISYEASFSMAAAFGGDSSYIPNRIGIIYGGSEDPQFGTISRYQTWSELRDELDQKNADVQVNSFSYSPSLKKVYKSDSTEDSSDSSSGEQTYEGNAVIFHAHSDSVTAGAFGTYDDDANTAQGQIFKANTYIYQAVLLNQKGSDYKVIARASLKSGTRYLTKPENFEVAIDWTIKFF